MKASLEELIDPDQQQAAAIGVFDQPVDSSEPESGSVSRAGFLGHIDDCVRRLAAWLGGNTTLGAEIGSLERDRVQLWRWLHSDRAVLDDGTPIDFALFDAAIQRVGERLPRRGLPGQGNLLQAAWLLAELTHARTLPERVAVPVCAAGC
jgi:malate synthase